MKMSNERKFSVFSILLPFFLLCIILCGCSNGNSDMKDSDKQITAVTDKIDDVVSVTVVPSASPEPTKVLTPEPSEVPTPVATSTPTPTPLPATGIGFIKQNYESFGRSNVYRMSFNDLNGNFDFMAGRFAGDYALFWITRTGNDFSDGVQSGEYLILTKPAVSTEQYMVPVDRYFSYINVLENGTVIAAEWDTSKIRVYDNRLNLIRSFVPGTEGVSKVIGVTKDGTVWTVDEKNAKVLATDISETLLYEYSYDPGIRVTQYLTVTDGKSCFEAVSNDESYIHSFMFLSVSDGEITYSGEYDPELGEELKENDVYIDGLNIIISDYTWFLHDPGNVREMVVFPKYDIKEEYAFIQGKKLCTELYQVDGNLVQSQNFRIYDIDDATVSETLKNTDISNDIFLFPKGIIEDNIVVLYANQESEGNSILLWDASENIAQITDFCDFSKQEPEKYLSEQAEKLKDSRGVVITPDKYGESDYSDMLGKIVVGIDFVNTFKVGKFSDPEVLVSKNGDYIHPENMRNNTGTTHIFKPHVFSDYYLKEHGEKARESFFNFVDAVRAGEDKCKCPDPDAAGWCSGRFATYFYPVLTGLTYCEYMGDGWAKIYYIIPKEEVLEKIRDFDQRICDILNDVIEDDYNDFEKTLALYEFITEYCTYDYVAMKNEDGSWDEKESGYRVLIEKQGICWEISCLYKYLLLQCEVDIEEAGGDPVDPSELPHAWNHVVLDGQAYLIDATWGLSDKRKPDLQYFLFTDEMRVNRDGFEYGSLDIADYANNEMPEVYPYDADDDRYKDLWSGKYIAFDQNEKCIFYLDENDIIRRFDY